MKQIAKFLVGSRAFFDGVDGFNPKDSDWLYIMDDFGTVKAEQLRFRLGGCDRILSRNFSKQEYIENTLRHDTEMLMGKFFVPEFAEYIGLEVHELSLFEKYLYTLDDRHKYYKIIYESYIENGCFELTDEQRMLAYAEYVRYRK